MGIQERKERDKERRQQQIIVAAKRVFSEKGFTKATMEDIAREAELSPGTLYLYFKNKDELSASLSLRLFKYLNLRLQEVDDNKSLSPEDKVKALMDVMIDFYEFDPFMVINTLHLHSSEIMGQLSAELLTEIETLFGKAMDSITAIFESATKAGVFIEENPRSLAEVFWAMFSGLILWESSKTLINSDKNFLKQTIETAFDVFCRGLEKD